VKPEFGSKRGSRARPRSTTARIAWQRDARLGDVRRERTKRRTPGECRCERGVLVRQ
jgi:hypothetical protein